MNTQKNLPQKRKKKKGNPSGGKSEEGDLGVDQQRVTEEIRKNKELLGQTQQYEPPKKSCGCGGD